MKPESMINGLSILLLLAFLSCGLNDSKKEKNENLPYSLAHPDETIKLGEELNEISGLAYAGSDSLIYAIEDEHGILFSININENGKTSKWDFANQGDYEDLAVLNNVFYILKSNGNITSFQLESGKAVETQHFKINAEGKNEFESLYYDESLKKLILICKDCKGESKSQLNTWSFDPQTHLFQQESLFPTKIKKHLKPSAAAIHPLTGQLYILSSINKELVIMDKKGNFLNTQSLDPSLFKQPEGIAFNGKGDMFISNERNKSGTATLLIFKSK